MGTSTEIAAVCKAWLSSARDGQPCWLATVTAIEGSSCRRPGARLLFTGDQILAGAINGDCLERELARMGPFLARSGPAIKVFDSQGDDDEVKPGSGCDRKIHVLVEPLGSVSDGGLSTISRELAAERRVAVATVIRSTSSAVPLGSRVTKTGDGLQSQVTDSAITRQLAGAATSALHDLGFTTREFSCGPIVALLEVVGPPPHLFVFGSGADAVPVIRLAAMLGWNVTLCGAASHVVSRDRFPKLTRVSSLSLADNVAELDRSAQPLAVVMSHDYANDCNVLAALVQSKARYVGMLGPPRRTQRIWGEVERRLGAVSALRKAQVFGPAGLAIGAETSEEIALSILAEAQAVLAASRGGALREQRGTSHEPRATLELVAR